MCVLCHSSALGVRHRLLHPSLMAVRAAASLTALLYRSRRAAERAMSAAIAVPDSTGSIICMSAFQHVSQEDHLVVLFQRRMTLLRWPKGIMSRLGIQDVFQTTRNSFSPEPVVRSAIIS